MSDLFSIYEDSLNIVLRTISQIIDSMRNLSKEKTENALNEAHNNLKEADRVLKQMELEVESERSNQMKNMLLSKNEVETLRAKFLKLQESYINKKSQDALMILETIDYNNINAPSQRKKLIENEDKDEGGYDDDKIEQLTQIQGNISNNGINETTLKQIHIRDTVFNMKDIPLTTKIIRRINKNCILISIILLVVVSISIGLCIFFNYKYKNGNSTGNI